MSVSDDAAPTHTCTDCGGAAKAKRGKATINDGPVSWAIPNRWAALGGRLLCGKCKDKHYVPRAIELPVASVQIDGHQAWEAFRPIFQQIERGVSRLGNWAISEYYSQDPIRSVPYAEDTTAPNAPREKLPQFKQPYLYGDPRSSAVAPGMDSRIRNEVLRQAWKLYSKHRMEIFLGTASTATFTRPTPIPIVGQMGRLTHQDGVSALHVTLGKQPFKLILAAGPRYKRQAGILQRIEDGSVIARSYSLCRLSAGAVQHRPLIAKGSRLVCKIVVLMPKQAYAPAAPDRTLYVSTSADAMLRYGCHDDVHKRLVYNADHVRRRRYAHRRQLDRLSQDKKMFPRGSNNQRDIAAQIAQQCAKENAWLHDFCHVTAKMLVDFAVRQRVARIEYDGTRRDYIQEFPWYKLSKLIDEKATAAGLTFVSIGQQDEEDASAAVVTEPRGTLAVE